MNSKYIELCLSDGTRYHLENVEGLFQRIDEAIADKGYVDVPYHDTVVRVVASHITRIIFTDLNHSAFAH